MVAKGEGGVGEGSKVGVVIKGQQEGFLCWEMFSMEMDGMFCILTVSLSISWL